jgi:hypothetical protein
MTIVSLAYDARKPPSFIFFELRPAFIEFVERCRRIGEDGLEPQRPHFTDTQKINFRFRDLAVSFRIFDGSNRAGCRVDCGRCQYANSPHPPEPCCVILDP